MTVSITLAGLRNKQELQIVRRGNKVKNMNYLKAYIFWKANEFFNAST